MFRRLSLVFAFFGIIVSLGRFSWAVRQVGNGGNTLVCRVNETNPHPTIEVQLLDFYEGESLRKWIPQKEGQSRDEILQFFLKRLARVSPRWSERLRLRYQNFFSSALFLPNVQLSPVQDSFHVAIPKNCEIHQTILQHQKLLPNEAKYHIDADLWSLLSSQGQAGLILHELIYEDAINESHHEDSRATRYLISLIASQDWPQWSELDFYELLKKLNFVRAELQGFDLQIFKIEEPLFAKDELKYLPRFPLFFNNGKIEQAFAWPESTIDFNGAQIILGSAIQYSGRPPTPDLFFYESGHFKSVEAYIPSGPFTVMGETFYGQGKLQFFQNGQLQKIEKVHSPSWVVMQNQKFWVENNLEFYESGKLKKSSYPETGQIQWSQGALGTLMIEDHFTAATFEVYENGNLREANVVGGHLKSPLFDLELGLNMGLLSRLSFFHENGDPKDVWATKGWIIKNGQRHQIKKGTHIQYP